jgi:hypothetical protein
MAMIAMEPPLRAEGSEPLTMASYNIQSGCNGGLESALQPMKLMVVNFGVLLETTLTKGVYMHWSSGYNVQSTHAPSTWQGGISLFFGGGANERYEINEVELHGPNVLLFQLVLGATRWCIVGCYIPPTDLTTLMHAKQTWLACPKGCQLILLGDLNVNLAALRNEQDKTIAKQVDIMKLIDMSSRFPQRLGINSWGWWRWWMRRRRRWVSAQCDCILGQATNLGRF